MEMHNIINLDDAKTSITFKISGKDFEIKRIVLAVRDQWVIFSGKTAQFQSDIFSLIENGGDTEKHLQNFAEWKASFIDKILGKLLETNGYDYDAEWWADNADYDDIMRFIIGAIQKDTQNDDKKKEQDSK
jgi:hypothetical protein